MIKRAPSQDNIMNFNIGRSASESEDFFNSIKTAPRRGSLTNKKGAQKERKVEASWMKPLQETEWKQSQSCQICDKSFGKLETREHHCRYCGKAVCSKCSNNEINTEKSCDLCIMKVKLKTQMDEKKELITQQNKVLEIMKAQILDAKENINDLQMKLGRQNQDLIYQQEEQERIIEQVKQEVIKMRDKLIKKNENNRRLIQTIEVEQEQIQQKEKENQDLKQKKLHTDSDNASKFQIIENKRAQLAELQKQKQGIINSKEYQEMENEKHITEQRKALRVSGIASSMIENKHNDFEINIQEVDPSKQKQKFPQSTPILNEVSDNTLTRNVIFNANQTKNQSKSQQNNEFDTINISNTNYERKVEKCEIF